ncbi:imidazole glycerol phosphate synthase [Pseudomonas syringae]|uniref:hypothetical protein n=1 Tax=Pseudomonas syringae TaxID=317 RepID=UPI001CA8EDD9|nr:hypothetical protein [Pseudomonas syringae]MCI3945049.1 imidazole glycerol phosphate synthase [Pseudomonas syringae]
MSNSLKGILRRARAGTVTQGWGAIVAISRSDLNRHIEQQYIERYPRLAFLPLFTGDIGLDEHQVDTLRLTGIELGVPTLSFQATSSRDTSVLVIMNIVAGRYSGLHQPAGSATTVSTSFRIAEPMGFRLTMTAHLVSDDSGHVTFDLAKSTGFHCNLAGLDEGVNQLLADFFARQFSQIAIHRSLFSLVPAVLGQYQAQLAQGFRMLTRSAPGARSPKAKNFGDGALLLFMKLRGSAAEGRFPPTRDFVYPIPTVPGSDNQGKYGTVVMLSHEMLLGRQRVSLPDSIKFAAGDTFQASEQHALHDRLVFGSMLTTPFSVAPRLSTIQAGQSQRFMLHNPQGQEVPVLSWKAFSLQSHRPDGHGSISATGVYTAPDPALMGHDALRVVITATYEASGEAVTASALLSVVYESMELAPRVTVVAGGGAALQSVSLRASALDGSPIDWGLLGNEYGELSEVEGGALFVPDEKRSGKRALITQQIEAQGSESGIATVLIVNGQQMLRIEPAFVPRARRSVPVQLQDDSALLAGLARRWKVVGGAGSVDQQGRFMPPDDPVVTSSVVSCEVIHNGVVLACGYSVIELSEVIDEPRWKELSLFTVTVPGGPVQNSQGSLYPNGYQQLRLQVKTQTMPVNNVEYDLSAIELASMRLVDNETHQNLESVSPILEGIPEKGGQAWQTRLEHNRFELASPGAVATDADLNIPNIISQNFYLHSRALVNFEGVFYATFQDEENKWWTSLDLDDINSKVSITPRRLPVFDTANYTFVPTRVWGGGSNPTPEPPAEGAADDTFDFHPRTIDYWTLSVRNPETQQWVGFETMTFLSAQEDVPVTSIILWEAELVDEIMFSWTGYIFDDSANTADAEKIRFDEGVRYIGIAPELLDFNVDKSVFEKGKLVISLHRSDDVVFVDPEVPERKRLSGSLAVLLIDHQGNTHKRKISFLPDSIVGRRNRLMHTLYSPTLSS